MRFVKNKCFYISKQRDRGFYWWLTDDKRLKNSAHLNWRWDLRCITEALLTWSIKQSLSNHQEHPNICIETCYKLSKSLRNCIATPWQPLIKPLHQMILHRHTLLKCSAGALRDYRVPRKCLELVSCIALYQWRAQTSRGAGEKWRYEGKFVDRFRGREGCMGLVPLS